MPADPKLGPYVNPMPEPAPGVVVVVVVPVQVTDTRPETADVPGTVA